MRAPLQLAFLYRDRAEIERQNAEEADSALLAFVYRNTAEKERQFARRRRPSAIAGDVR